jgi:hypothetical protein
MQCLVSRQWDCFPQLPAVFDSDFRNAAGVFCCVIAWEGRERLKRESGRFAKKNETPAVSMVTVAWGQERKRLPWEWGVLPPPPKLQEFSRRHYYTGSLLHGGSLTSRQCRVHVSNSGRALWFSLSVGFWNTANGVPIILSMHSAAVLWRTIAAILCSPEPGWIWCHISYCIAYRLLWQRPAAEATKSAAFYGIQRFIAVFT